MLDPAFGALLAGLFALLFASAALHKLRAPVRFAEVFAAYRVVPARLVGAARGVPVLESVIAAGLLVRGVRTGAACTGAVLLVLYAVAIAINLKRGRHDLACGCGGPNERRPIASWMVARNLLLAGVLGLLTVPWQPRPFEATDLLTVGGGTAVAALIYLSLDRLFSRVRPLGARLQGAP